MINPVIKSYQDKATGELLPMLAKGDEQAYRIIYDRYKVNIYSTILNLADDTFLAEEVLQETFIRLWNYKHKLMHVLNFEAWIYRVAKNVFLTKIRSKALSTEPLDLILHDIYYAPMNHSHAEYKDMEYAFEQAIAHLSPKQRVTYQMIKLEGLTRKEVAQLLDVSPETVKWNLDESVKKVRSYMMHALDKLPFVAILYFLAKK